MEYLKDNDTSIEKVTSVIIQCFAIILIGYIFSRLNIITKNQSTGISILTSKLVLPSLIFISLVKVDFTTVNWRFVYLVFLSKFVIFFLVATLCLILTKPSNFGLAGIYSIFCTQGNDFAFGYPILSVLYEPSKQYFLDYLYILAPIQLIILNPIATCFLEIHSSIKNSTNDSRKKAYLIKILTNVIKNPINIMTFIGIVWNLIIKDKLPIVLLCFFTTIGNSFTALALFLLGFNINRSFKKFKKSEELIIPVILVIVKIIILPLVSKTFVEKGMVEDPKTISEFSSLAFLFGVIPTAPAAFIYALEYDVKFDIIANSMIFCTFLSAPLIFVSSNVIRANCGLIDNLVEDLNKFLVLISKISLPCILWVLVLFMVGKKYKLITHRCTIFILLSQILVCIGGCLLPYIKKEENNIFFLHYILCVCGIFSGRIWTSVLALTISLLYFRSLCRILKIYNYIIISALLMNLILISIVIINLNFKESKSYHLNFQFDNIIDKISSFVLILSLLIVGLSIIIYQRSSQSINQINYNYLINYQENLQVPTTSNSQITDIEDINYENYCDSNQNCDKAQRKICQHNIRQYQQENISINDIQNHLFEEPDLILFKKTQVFIHVMYLLIAFLSMLVNIEVGIGQILTSKLNGIFIELQYLNVFLNYGLGLFLFFLFGFEIDVLFRNNKVLHLNQHINLSEKNRKMCNDFKLNYLDRCKKEILFKLNDHEIMCFVFRSNDLVSWLINVKLVKNKNEGELYAQNLLENGIIEHITNEQYFSNTTYLYKFK